MAIFYVQNNNGNFKLLGNKIRTDLQITPSVTPTSTVTPAIPLTPSITASVTPTVTPTISVTPSITASVTPTRTPTISLTPSVTASVTPTVTPTISLTPSITASVTPTVTPTISVTPSITASVTPTKTKTPTPSPQSATLFTSPNSAWTSGSLTGNGSVGTPFSSSSFLTSGGSFTAASITCINSGVIHITASSVTSDSQINIYKNGTNVYSSYYDPTNGVTVNSLNITFTSITNNFVIKLGDDNDYTAFNTFRMWWTAT